MTEKLIRISLACNQRCLFCNTLNKREPIENIDSIKKSVWKLRKQPGLKMLITGGEPTIRPDLFKLIGIIKKALPADAAIGIQTNALRCSYMAYTQQLSEAGISYAFVPFHHNTRSVFNHITQNPDSFDYAIAGIKNLARCKVAIDINIVINSYNYKDLIRIVGFVKNNFDFNCISFSYVQPHGLAEQNYTIVPPYSKARKYIIQAYAYCLKEKVAFFNPNCGLPLCMVKGYEKYSQDFRESAVSPLISQYPNKIKTAKCLKCKRNNRCYGIWQKYVDMYGYQELLPY